MMCSSYFLMVQKMNCQIETNWNSAPESTSFLGRRMSRISFWLKREEKKIPRLYCRLWLWITNITNLPLVFSTQDLCDRTPHWEFTWPTSKISWLQVCVCASGHECVNVQLLKLLRLLLYIHWITIFYINTVWVNVFVRYMFRSLRCLKVWYVSADVSLLKEWHRIPCWDDPFGFGEGQWQGFRPPLCALCVNTASETWPQLIKLMTERGGGDTIHGREIGIWYLWCFEAGRDEETATIKAETPANQAKMTPSMPQFKPQYCLNETNF